MKLKRKWIRFKTDWWRAPQCRPESTFVAEALIDTYRRAVSPQREVLSQLIHDDFPFIQPDNRVYFRDVYDHLVRIIEELDSLREILSSTL